MKLKQLLFTITLFSGIATTAQVKVGTNPTVINASAELEIESASKGFLPPRLTTEQRDAIANPAEGLTIYNSTTKCLNFYNSTAWVSLCETATTPGTEDPGTEDPGTEDPGTTTPLTYCEMTVQWQVYALTSVTFAGINNQTPNTAATPGDAMQFFLDQTATVTAGQSYPISLKGNTGSWVPQVCYFTVFADWNKDGDFADAGETYQAGSVQGSTGLDEDVATASIAVPANALTGVTRLRIIFNTSAYATDPCAQYSWAQSEDYTITVGN